MARPWVRLRGREDDFTALYRENYEAVRSVLFRFQVLDLDDLVQEVFIKAYRNRGAFRGEAASRTWLIRIAINAAKDHLKSSRASVKTIELEPRHHGAERPDSGLADTIESCLGRLSAAHRDVLIVCAIEGYSMAEAAVILDVVEGTVKSRLSAARLEMKELLKREGVDP